MPKPTSAFVSFSPLAVMLEFANEKDSNAFHKQHNIGELYPGRKDWLMFYIPVGLERVYSSKSKHMIGFAFNSPSHAVDWRKYIQCGEPSPFDGNQYKRRTVYI